MASLLFQELNRRYVFLLIPLLSVLAIVSLAESRSCVVCNALRKVAGEPAQETSAVDLGEIVDCIDYTLFGTGASSEDKKKFLEKWGHGSTKNEGSISNERKIPAFFKLIFGKETAVGQSFSEGDVLHE